MTYPRRVALLVALLAAAALRLPAQSTVAYSDAVQAATQAVAACRTLATCLVPTQNAHAFLELDTATGQVWEVQLGPDPDRRVKKAINSTALDQQTGRLELGRFLLWPTPGVFDFILLDTESGRVWQVQWGNTPGFNLISETKPAGQ